MGITCYASDAAVHAIAVAAQRPATRVLRSRAELSSPALALEDDLVVLDLDLVRGTPSLLELGIVSRAKCVVLFSALDAATSETCLLWLHYGATALFAHQDDPRLLEQVLTNHERSLSTRLLAALAPRLLQLPQNVQASVLRAFSLLAGPDSVKLLAVDAHVTRRSLDRWFQRAGVNSPKRLIDVARLALYHGRARRPWTRARSAPVPVRTIDRQCRDLLQCSRAQFFNAPANALWARLTDGI